MYRVMRTEWLLPFDFAQATNGSSETCRRRRSVEWNRGAVEAARRELMKNECGAVASAAGAVAASWWCKLESESVEQVGMNRPGDEECGGQ